MKSTRMMIQLVIATVFVSSSFAADSSDSCTVDGEMANLGFTLKDMHGEDVLLSDYRGKVILLDFWATWCAPCRIEIPGFIELLDSYENDGLAVLGISVDDPVDALQFYAEEMGMDYPVLIGDGRDDVKDSYGPLMGFPTTLLINRDGTVCHRHTGFVPKSQFEAEIQQLL